MDFFWTIIIVVSVAGFLSIVVAPVLLTRVPYVPTPHKRFNVLFSYLEQHASFPNITFVDVGCGYGNVVAEAVRRGCRSVIGVEYSPVHAVIARWRFREKKDRVQIIRGDFFAQRFPAADVFYLFLTSRVLDRVAAHIQKTAKPGAIIVVLSDAVTGKRPIATLLPDGPTGTKIYCYRT